MRRINLFGEYLLSISWLGKASCPQDAEFNGAGRLGDSEGMIARYGGALGTGRPTSALNGLYSGLSAGGATLEIRNTTSD